MDNNRMKDGMPMGDEQPGQGALAMMQNQGGELAQKVVQYVCGCKYQHFFFIQFKLECGMRNELVIGDQFDTQEIKCKSCSGRIFYKVRQRKPLQYEAR